jgi:hypothetical protein
MYPYHIVQLHLPTKPFTIFIIDGYALGIDES